MSSDDDLDWKDVIVLHAGEDKGYEKEIEKSNKIRITSSSTLKANNEIDLFDNTIISSIENKFKFEIMESQSIENENTTKEKQREFSSIKLPPIPEDVTKKYIMCSILQSAQVHKKYSLILKKDCSCCKGIQLEHYKVFVPTERFCLRRKNTFNDGSNETITINT